MGRKDKPESMAPTSRKEKRKSGGAGNKKKKQNGGGGGSLSGKGKTAVWRNREIGVSHHALGGCEKGLHEGEMSFRRKEVLETGS